MSDVRLCAFDDLIDGEPKQVRPVGHPVVTVYRVGDEVFVSEDSCTHAQASLGEEGYLEGFVITCGWHLAAYDVRDGSMVSGPCTRPLKTYPAEVRDGAVHADLPDA